MGTTLFESVERRAIAAEPAAIDVALLGLGTVGTEVAARSRADEATNQLIRVVGALVRNRDRPRDARVAGTPLTSDGLSLLDRSPDVVVEVLGGLEPARTLVRTALERGIAVVTANKSLMAVHGDELLRIASETGAPLLYEAAVLAGVPFLGAFARRPRAAALSSMTGIVNGTSNFILTAAQKGGGDCATALAEAQRLGFAEPDPGADVKGIDAAEKLAVLARHFGFGSIHPAAIETRGIDALDHLDFFLAADLGGTVKPLVHAERSGDSIGAFVGPAFVPWPHKLSRIDGVENAVVLRNTTGELLFSGPGAGPAATATTILDDVVEAAEGTAHKRDEAVRSVRPQAPATSWMLRVGAAGLPPADEMADLLGSHGVWLRRTSLLHTRDGRQTIGALTYSCSRERVERAAGVLHAAAGAEVRVMRAIEVDGRR